jgi:hypothetical protein
MNVLCYVDNVGNCAFDGCTEGSYLNDDGDACLSLSNCGYETFDDSCKTSTAKFTSIDVGSVLGVVWKEKL